MRKRAIHFGVEAVGGTGKSTFFDGIKDASYYHSLSRNKGFESSVRTSDKLPIHSNTIKEGIKQLVDENDSHGEYFISVSAGSTVGKPFWGMRATKTFDKYLKLHNNSRFGIMDLNECLSYFSNKDKVFFLITDCKSDEKRKILSLIDRFKSSNKISAKAVVMSLSFDHVAMYESNISSLAADINVVLNSAKAIGDLLHNLDALYGDKSYVKRELFCYNLAEENGFFLNN